MKLGKSQRDKSDVEVASIAVVRDGALLWLRRADCALWTLPGGHLNPGEEPLDGALRELREETGLTPPESDIEFLGDDLVPGKAHLRIYCFVVEVPPDTKVDLSQDPDQEASEYEWKDELPESDHCYVSHGDNVTLKFLLENDELSKAEQKEWRAKDGLKIPHHTTPARAEWDKAYHKKLVEFFGAGDPQRLKPVKIPITPQTSGTNPVVSKARYSLYTRMLAGGDRLPPAVVRRNGIGWHVVDGNHRLEAALKRGLKEMDAYELVDPPKKTKKSEEDLEKGYPKDAAENDANAQAHAVLADKLIGEAKPVRYNRAAIRRPDEHLAQANAYRDTNEALDSHPGPAGDVGDIERMVYHRPREPANTRFATFAAGNKFGNRRNEAGSNIIDQPSHVYEPSHGYASRNDHDRSDTADHNWWASVNRDVGLRTPGETYGGSLRDIRKKAVARQKERDPRTGVLTKTADDDLVAATTASLDNALRKPQYRSSPNPLAGHCYVASEALWHMMGGHESGWVPQNVKHEGDQHWYLRHSKTGQILDPTASQFRTPVPYHQGRGRGFLTKQPSKRAQEVINRVQAKLGKAEDLTKGLFSTAALAGAMALGQVGGAEPDPKPAKALVEATQRAGIAAEPVKWSALGLHQALIPIAHLESSFGQNINHAKHPKGDYHTAHGALGFKPVTAHEEYLRAPVLQKLYGDMKDPAVFLNKFKTDPKFYNLLATSHFMRLQKQHGSPERAAYAWRWGTGACQGASDEQVATEPYVMRYRNLAANAGLKKMAIKDLKPGTELHPEVQDDFLGSKQFDYSHMIKSPLLRRQYQLVLHQYPVADRHGVIAKVNLWHRPTNSLKGFLEGSKDFIENGRTAINPSYATIRDPELTGKRFGQAMYEALFAHAHHVMGYRHVTGDTHSTSAHRVHEKLAGKHGWAYKPEFKPRQAPQERPFDDEYGPYQYKLT